MKKNKSPKPAALSVGNLELALAMRGKSSAAGFHADKRTKRNRDRAAQKRNAIRDSY